MSIAIVGVAWLVLFGAGYAWLIHKHPFGLAVVEVCIGVAGTLVGQSVVLYGLLGWPESATPLAVLWGGLAITGVPMVATQLNKEFNSLRESLRDATTRDTGPLGRLRTDD